jgi:hypothetical protein
MSDTCTEGGCLGAPAKHPYDDLLPEYATLLALGAAPPPHFDQLKAHLDVCADCQADLDDLLELTVAAYTEHLEPSIEPPGLDRAALRSILNNSVSRWCYDRHTLVVVLSASILQAVHDQSLAGALRGQLLYRYVQDQQSVANLEVAIDVYAEDAHPGQSRVRVSVEVPSRDPMDQAGCRVALHADEAHWAGQTDELGLVDFAPVPLNALPHMRVEITPVGAE